MLLVSLLLAHGSGAQQVAGGGHATGALLVTVISERGRAVAGAQVSAGDEGAVATSDAGIAFVPKVGAGRRTVHARAIGYAPIEREVDVPPGDTLRVTLELAGLPQLLDPVRVSARMSEVERRREGGRGYVMTGEELEKAPLLSAVVPQRPAFVMNIQDARGAGTLRNLLVKNRLGRFCVPKVLLNGNPSSRAEVSDYRPQDLAAVELYVDFADAPREFMRPSDAQCGLLLVWTK